MISLSYFENKENVFTAHFEATELSCQEAVDSMRARFGW